MDRAEKWLYNKVEGNKVIRVSEFIEFNDENIDIDFMIERYYDDPEEAYSRGMFFDIDGALSSYDVDNLISALEEYKQTCIDDEEELPSNINNTLSELEKFKGHTIFCDVRALQNSNSEKRS